MDLVMPIVLMIVKNIHYQQVIQEWPDLNFGRKILCFVRFHFFIYSRLLYSFLIKLILSIVIPLNFRDLDQNLSIKTIKMAY